MISLRGAEGLLLDLEGLWRHFQGWTNDKTVIALKGKVKGEHHFRCHLIPCTAVTKSGINVRGSIERLMNYKKRSGWIDGPAISNEKGLIYSTRAIDDALHEILEEVFVDHRDLLPPVVGTLEDLKSKYHAFRSFRRSSDSRALAEKVA